MMRYVLLVLFLVMFVGGPFGLHDSIVTGFSIKNAFLYALVVKLGIEIAVSNNLKLEAFSIIVPFCLLLAYCLLSYATVVSIVKYPDYGIVENGIQLKSKLIDQFLMFLVFFYGLNKKDDPIWLIRMVIWMVMLTNIMTLADAFDFPDLYFITQSVGDRVQGFIGQMNQYGAFLAFFLPGTVALFRSEKGLKRILAGIGVFATFACLLLTFSRGSYVGAIVGALFASFFLRDYISVRVVINASIAGLVACAAAVPLLFLAGYGDVLMERLSLVEGNVDTISQGRTTLWMHALSVMQENPLTFITGYGWNAYENFRQFRLSTHNLYLNYLFNIGIIGLAFFVMTLFGVLVALRRRVRSLSGIDRSLAVSAIFGFSALCVCIFFSQLYYAGVLVWAYIGLVLRMAIVMEIDSSNRDDGLGLAVRPRETRISGAAAKGATCSK